MLPAIVCGIAIWDAPVGYWPSFFFFAKANSAQVPSRFKVANEYRKSNLTIQEPSAQLS